MEHSVRTRITPSESLQLILEREFGGTKVSFFVPSQPNSVEASTTQ
jgi:hypothetical protein